MAGELDTFPRLLLHHAQVRPDRPAIREKDLGIWQTWTWREVEGEVRALACGLAAQGFKRGMSLAIIGENRPRLYWAMAAAQSLGGIPVPIYQDAVAQEMVYVFHNADIEYALVEDQEQVDKLLEIMPQCPQLAHIYFDDPRGMRHYAQTALMSFDNLQAIGRDFDGRNPEYFADEVAKGSATDIASMFYTSGTTGSPKGVTHTHQALIAAGRAGAEMEGLDPSDEVLAYLPMAWIGQNIFSYTQSYVVGFCISCPESAETVGTDMREIGRPTTSRRRACWRRCSRRCRSGSRTCGGAAARPTHSSWTLRGGSAGRSSTGGRCRSRTGCSTCSATRSCTGRSGTCSG